MIPGIVLFLLPDFSQVHLGEFSDVATHATDRTLRCLAMQADRGGETDAEAQSLFKTPQQHFLRLIRNQPVELLPTSDSQQPLWQNWERTAAVENKLDAAIVGSNSTVKAGLQNLVCETLADEVIVVTDTYEHTDRLQSYRRVADVAMMIEAKPTVAANLRKGRVVG